MEPKERLLRQLIGEVILECAAYEAAYRQVDTSVSDDFRMVRRMLADGVNAIVLPKKKSTGEVDADAK